MSLQVGPVASEHYPNPAPQKGLSGFGVLSDDDRQDTSEPLSDKYSMGE